MTFLNTHWTWSYFFMLLFVFWTLFKAVKLYYVRTAPVASYTNGVLGLMWAALGTYFFHCVW